MDIYYVEGNEEKPLKITTENPFAAKKVFTLIKKAFNIVADISEKNSTNYSICVQSDEDALRLMQAVKIGNRESSVTTKNCCKRAYLRGAFLAAGSISDPEKFYHFEIVCPEIELAGRIQEMIGSFGIEARIVERKNHQVVYVKDGTNIAELLNIMEAHGE
jgi:DNA-binding protein WhiA